MEEATDFYVVTGLVSLTDAWADRCCVDLRSAWVSFGTLLTGFRKVESHRTGVSHFTMLLGKGVRICCCGGLFHKLVRYMRDG